MSSDLRETSLDKLVALNSEYYYYSLPLAAKQLGDIDRLPKSMKVLLENLLRHVDGDTVQVDDLKAIVAGCKPAMLIVRSPTVRRAC